MFSSAVSSFVKREGEDITGNATAIAEICGTPDEVDRIGLRVRASGPRRLSPLLNLLMLLAFLSCSGRHALHRTSSDYSIALCARSRTPSSFQILVTSLMGTCFPILAKRIPFLRRHVPGAVFEFAKYVGHTS